MVMTVATQVIVTTTVEKLAMTVFCVGISALTKLKDEEPLKLMWRSKQDRKLDRPEDDMADHLLSGDPNRCRDMVGDVKIGRPDSTNALSHCCRSSVGLNSMPEERSSHSYDDGETSEVPAEGRLHSHGEGYVKTGSKNTVQDQWHSAAKTSEDDADNGLTPSQPNSENGRRGHPGLSVKSITEPEACHCNSCPSSSIKRRHVHVNIGPDEVRIVT